MNTTDPAASEHGHPADGHQVYTDPKQPEAAKYILDLKYTHYVNDDRSIFSTPDNAVMPSGPGWREMKTVYPN